MRRIIENRFGKDFAADKRWLICGDFNDYRQRIVIGGDALGRLHLHADRRGRSPASTCCLPTALPSTSSSAVPSSTAGRSTTRAAPRSGISASSTTSCCRRRWPNRTARPCPTSSAAGSRGAPSSRPARRSSAIRAPAGIGPKASDHCPVADHPRHRLNIVGSRMDFDIPRGSHPAGRARRRHARSRAASVRGGQPGGDRCRTGSARRPPTRRCSTARCRCWRGSPIATGGSKAPAMRSASRRSCTGARPGRGRMPSTPSRMRCRSTSDGALIAIRMGRARPIRAASISPPARSSRRIFPAARSMSISTWRARWPRRPASTSPACRATRTTMRCRAKPAR